MFRQRMSSIASRVSGLRGRTNFKTVRKCDGRVVHIASTNNVALPSPSSGLVFNRELSSSAGGITPQDIASIQQSWGEALVEIGHADEQERKAVAESRIAELYDDFDQGKVLFKPTKAAEVPFRLTREGALSYFITGSIAEDTGFALEPWKSVRFDNAGVVTLGEKNDSAVAMGHYFFTSASTGDETKVEYTFVYRKDPTTGAMKICTQHSSIPFQKS